MKHLLNNLSESEKNEILKQHTDVIKVVSENFDKLTESKLGNVKPLISEQIGGKEAGPAPLPSCDGLMKNQNDMVGSSLLLQGPIDKITANFTVMPKYQGYTIHKDGRPFCFIKKG